jgi:hypothetical protein
VGRWPEKAAIVEINMPALTMETLPQPLILACAATKSMKRDNFITRRKKS